MSKNYVDGWRVAAVPEIERSHEFYDDSGILYIECIPAGKRLIFSASNISKQLKWHFGELLKKRHPNKRLQASYDRFGADAFTWGLLELCASSELRARKPYWISKYSMNTLFNSESEMGNRGEVEP